MDGDCGRDHIMSHRAHWQHWIMKDFEEWCGLIYGFQKIALFVVRTINYIKARVEYQLECAIEEGWMQGRPERQSQWDLRLFWALIVNQKSWWVEYCPEYIGERWCHLLKCIELRKNGFAGRWGGPRVVTELVKLELSSETPKSWI